jgi:hypothetical protein
VKIMASVEDPAVIGRTLVQLEQTRQASGSAADLTTAHRARGLVQCENAGLRPAFPAVQPAAAWVGSPLSPVAGIAPDGYTAGNAVH